jgi:type III restriction enzyme
MELKSYQKRVVEDLSRFLEIVNETSNSITAYKQFWNEKNIKVGIDGVPPYNNTIKNTPHICFKVPTGGGKTFIACSSIKPIFDAMPFTKTKTVVWLVPSNAILEQTIKNLNDTDHPYRQKINIDFSGRVEVYTKEQLLNGQNFNITSVNEQLSICILSYDTFRSHSKENRKIYQENGNLSSFTKFYERKETLIENVDETALIQVINQLNPVIIVDESHNAITDLSVEMLINLNPSFVLDLTATPKANSNNICYVDAMELKKENMVKLPVIVYNRHDMKDVIFDSVFLRNKLEKQAIDEQKETGKYIRPIILFQAQQKGKDDNETFEKIKKVLITGGIPAEQIAIKTADINELKGVELLSPSCAVRYIITVNALKEGWDCPFAYILATLANRTSKVDVEQILGRILRLPYTKNHKNQFLNMSYVLTSSVDFRNTLEKIVVGLNNAGFSKNDYRIAEDENVQSAPHINTNFEQIDISNPIIETEENFDINLNEIKERLEQSDIQTEIDNTNENINEMLVSASVQNEEYNNFVNEVQNGETDIQPWELREKMKFYKMNSEFAEQVKNIKLPQFFIKCDSNFIITDGEMLLSKENLADGFYLKYMDTKINFDATNDDVYKIDIEGTNEATPKYKTVTKSESKIFKEYVSSLPQERQIESCKNKIFKELDKFDTFGGKELKDYIDRIVKNMSKDQIDNLENSVYAYATKIKEKVNNLLNEYLEKQFKVWLDTGKIICKGSCSFKLEISPLRIEDSISKSLYSAEEKMNDYEHEVIRQVAGLDNIIWWHKIMVDKTDFYINGFINHYPDFVVMTNKGNIVLIETKGDYLDNNDSRQKVKLGREWQNKAGNNYRYFMVFLNKEFNFEGAYLFDEFIGIIKDL